MADRNFRQEILTNADYHPAGLYAFGRPVQGGVASAQGQDTASLLSFYSSFQVTSDNLSSQFIPLSATAQHGRNPKIFAIGILPPNQTVTGRLLDRSAQVPVKGRIPKESTTFVGPAAIAEQQLDRFIGQSESTTEGNRIIREEYWGAVGVSPPDPTKFPWSGAFITYVANNGAPGSLTPSGSHSIYAFAAKSKSPAPGKYKAYRPEDVTIQPNDIIIRSRGSDVHTFEDLNGSHFPSHGDVVTQVDGNSLRVIGGNVDNSVSVSHYSTNSEGKLSSDKRFFAVLRLVGVSDQPFQAQQVESDVEGNPNAWQSSGTRSAQEARKQATALENTDLRAAQSGLLAKQKSQIKAIQNALSAMASAPPLRMLVNPSKFSVKSTKIVQDGNWGRNGPIIEFWGDDQDKISGSGKVAGFYAIDATLTSGGIADNKLGRGGPGLTRAARNFSQSWQNFQALWLLYKNNGGLYLSETLSQESRDLLLSTVGSVYIYYDNILYFGSFDSFNVTEAADKPFTVDYSFEFTVRASFVLDLPSEFEGTGEALVKAQRVASLPSSSKAIGESDIVKENGSRGAADLLVSKGGLIRSPF